MKFPHYGKPSKQSRKSEKSGADSAERTIRTSSKAESFAKSAEKKWFVIGKVMVRCIFTVHLAISQNVVETFIDRIEVFNDEHVKIHFTFENVLADYAE